MIQKKSERKEMEAITVFSFRRRRRRPFLFDLYHVLEGICIYILNGDEKKKKKGGNVPSYTFNRRGRVCVLDYV
jgi:hypothetical protein